MRRDEPGQEAVIGLQAPRYAIGPNEYTADHMWEILSRPNYAPSLQELQEALDCHGLQIKGQKKGHLDQGYTIDVSKLPPEVLATILTNRYDQNLAAQQAQQPTPDRRTGRQSIPDTSSLDEDIFGDSQNDEAREESEHPRAEGNRKTWRRLIGGIACVAAALLPGVNGVAQQAEGSKVNAFFSGYIDALVTTTDFITQRKPTSIPRPAPSPQVSGSPNATAKPSAAVVPSATGSGANTQAGSCETQLAEAPAAKLLAQTVMIPVNGDGSSKDGRTSAAEVQRIIKQYDLGGVIVMSTPVKSLASFVAPGNYDVPLVVATDQEGGSVRRVKDGASAAFLSAADMAKKSDTEIIQIVQGVAKQLKSYGINTNFAPVLDLTPKDGTPSKIGQTRIFSSDPAIVARVAGLYASTMLKEGINPVYKHFGGGSMDQNTDVSTANVPGMEELKGRDLAPYKNVPHNSKTGLMIGSFKPSDGATGSRPANQSSVFYDLATTDYAYSGPLFTDDIGTKAAGGNLPIDFVDALQAGASMPLFVQDQSNQTLEFQVQAIIKEGTDALNAKTLSTAQLVKAVTRNAAAIDITACQVADGLNK